jgi:lysyl-tRNA synthetase class 2
MLEKVQADRLAKLEKVRQLGIDPYGGRYDSAQPISHVLERYTDDAEGQTADVAGRLVLIRDMGKMMFAHIRDQAGQMQIALRKNALDETSWQLAKLLDLGDIVAVAGPLQRTRTGEITVWAERLTLLCKATNPMPEKYHGLHDVETRYRRRYLDLMTNPDSMATFKKRIAIVQRFREVLTARGYLEVETPMLQALYGGAAAKPFVTHHNALDADLFMRISPELYLKRLLVGGMEKVFEINRNFRNEGLSTRHNPEFTMLELYEAYADMRVMMDVATELMTTSAEKVAGSLKIPFGDVEIDYTPPWREATYAELLAEHAGVDMFDSSALRDKARKCGIDEGNKDDAVVANLLFEELVEPHLVQPTFVTEYPADLCPLTRRKADNPALAERFELFIARMEIANAYSELNDPAVQEENFRRQIKGEADDETMRVMDEDFVTALRHGMPPAGGMGVGVDRAVMFLTNTQSIRDVILFPTLRPESGSTAKQSV